MATITVVVIGPEPENQIAVFTAGNESGRTKVATAVLQSSMVKKDISDLSLIQGDAVVCNNGWYEINGANWWSMAPEEQTSEEWDAKVLQLLEEFEPEMLISRYTCETV